MSVKRNIVGAAAGLCLVAAGWVAAGYQQSAPAPVNNRDTVWTRIDPPAPSNESNLIEGV